MSNGKIFSKSKSLEIRVELEQALKKTKPSRIKVVLRKVIANIILSNNELVNLMADIIPLMKMDDLELRKLCCYYLQTYAPMNPTAAGKALVFFDRWAYDNSSELKILALKTTSSIDNPDFFELSMKITKHLLNDKDTDVRKSAAFSVSRLYEHNSGRVEKSTLINDLNNLLYDENPFVVSISLASLGYIVENSKGLSLTIDKEHSLKLISFLPKTTEWGQTYILNSLMSYIPQTSEEAIDIIEACLPSLQHENSSVVLNTVKVIVYNSNYVKNPQLILPSLSTRLGSSLVSLISKPSEIQFVVLRNIILLLLGNRDLVSVDVQLFFCHYDDPIYIKDTKLEIIYLLANKNNVHVVLRELAEYATEVDISMSRKAIRAFGNLAIKVRNAADECVEELCDLCSNEIPYIVQESVIVLKNILRKYPGEFNYALNELLKHYKLITEPESKTSLIWILGQYGESINNAIPILEELIVSFKDDPIEVQYATMTATTKIYLKMPQEGESIVLKVLKWATEESDNPDIRDRAYLYWRLISSPNVSTHEEFQYFSKQVILNSNPAIATNNDNIDPHVVEELELNIGTLASIYLKPIRQVFRFAKPHILPESPALQPRRTYSSRVVKEEDLQPDVVQARPKATRRRSSYALEKHNSSLSSRTSNSATMKTSESPVKNEDNVKNFVKRLTRKASIRALR